MSLRENISTVIVNHILNRYGDSMDYANKILDSVRTILSSSVDEYVLPKEIFVSDLFPVEKKDDYQDALSKINEKEARRKKEGVYYTDCDVTDFLAANTFLHYAKPSERNVYGFKKALRKLDLLSSDQKIRIINASTLDPTCGTGEFLLSALSIKLRLFKQVGGKNYEELTQSVYGNDIEPQSTEITKIRIFFFLIDSFDVELPVDEIAQRLNANFSNVDAIVYDGITFGSKDVIIGNPPYIEYRKFDGKPRYAYGNVYADVLHNSVNSMTEDGIMAFVIPLSYISTIRMSKIRNYIAERSRMQIIMNFADRPDSLFSCVHQKLSVVIAQKVSDYGGVLSSSYNYWYQSERRTLFENIHLSPTITDNTDYWPKIGNNLEKSIYKKFQRLRGIDMLSFEVDNTMANLYINQRACFWMKAFTHDMHSDSYTRYSVPADILPFVFCLVNSSLFFLLWVIISDGWHITRKELSFIRIPANIGEPHIWQSLMNRLEEELENTKVYVGTKQVDYEYKHKECKYIIDEIDDQLAEVYKLSEKQLNYIKNFGLKYRLGDGA